MARVAVVTGGTRGIGEAISKALKAAGYTVAATYAGNEEAAKKFSDETGVKTYKFDVGDFNACMEGVKAIAADLGPVEVLVNNAGVTRDSLLTRMKPEQWDTVIRTNLTSCFNMTRAVLDSMREKGFGRIINITSMNGEIAQNGQSNYGAAKAGMIGFTRVLASENANKGITANCLAPGYTATEMVKTIPEKVMNEFVLPKIPVRRLAEPSEIARGVVFLAADESGYITGITLDINGGAYMA